MSKFTPGPWIVEKDKWGIRVQCRDSSPSLPFAITPICIIEQDGKKGMADARLIAVAPEIYEALKWAVEYTKKQLAEGCCFKNKDTPHWKAALAAIAKAEGHELD